jgi:MoaA/NifB/PqqE/SkfB family radical SAM enzyme
MPIDKKLARFLWDNRLYRKLLNYVVANYEMARLSTFVSSYPYQIFIDPSSRCTLRCPFCAVGTKAYPKPMKDMPLAAFKRLMAEIGPTMLVAELFIKGEPLMNKDIYEMIACCKSYRAFTRVSSNMQFLSKELAEKMVLSGLDHLLASIDGATQESYEAYRKGGKLDLALANMRHVVEAKKRLGRKNPLVEWKYIVFSHNEAELDLARKMAAEIGVDQLCFVPAFVGDAPLSPDQEKWLPVSSEYRMYGNSGANLEKTVASRVIEERCNLPWLSLSVDPLSNVQTCCRCNESQHDHGEVSRGSFFRVWNGKRYRDSRRYIREGRRVEGDPTNLCSTCTAKSSLNVVLPHEFEKAL